MDSLQKNDTTTSHHQPQPPAELPSHCARGCGFFGSEANHGLCSKCFNDYLEEKIAESTPPVDPAITQMIQNVNELADSIISLKFSDEVKCEPVVPILKNRCGCCNKKVGLLGFLCRCGETFCGLHRYPEAHPCEFDFKTNGKIVIEKENPVCIVDKFDERV